MKNKGTLFILSAPSGGGKSSIIKALLKEVPNLWLSVSVTTRYKRADEQDGLDYHFITLKEYAGLQQDGQLLESAQVYDYYYGTPKEPVFAKLASGTDVIFDIDWQGAQSLRQITQYQVVSIFLLPPSIAELKKRLLARGDDPAIIERRMLKAQDECDKAAQYDHALVNQDFAATLAAVRKIIA